MPPLSLPQWSNDSLENQWEPVLPNFMLIPIHEGRYKEYYFALYVHIVKNHAPTETSFGGGLFSMFPQLVQNHIHPRGKLGGALYNNGRYQEM